MANGRAAARGSGSRIIDYLFGRNALIGVASFMLLGISGFATWSGMADFIIGVRATGGSTQLREIGGLSLSADVFVITIVVVLTFLMWLALRETFRPRSDKHRAERFVTLPLYLFLALWSIGFGYGFWWSLIAGSEATRTSLSGLQEDARDAAAVVAARLNAVRIQLDNVVTWSESQMSREDTSGGSCGRPSGAGRGPLYNARRGVRDQVATLRDGISNSWIAPVQADLAALRKSAADLEGATVAERQQQFEAKASEIRGKARSIAARSNAFGKSTAAEMRALANAVSINPGESGFSCYDPTLAQRLRQAANQAAEPAILTLRRAAFTEGAAGVANAVKSLWGNIGRYLSSLMRFIASWGETSGNVTTSAGEPITGRDLIALLATIGVDFGLFVLMVLNPPLRTLRTRPLDTSVRQKVAEAIRNVNKRTKTDQEWVRRHFIHHRAASYFVIPNLYSSDPAIRGEDVRALAMNQLAGVLVDLDLLRWPQRIRYGWLRPSLWRWPGKFDSKFPRWWINHEFDQLRVEEKGMSETDLSNIRKARMEELQELKQQGVEIDEEKEKRIKASVPLRNHGLFSKAEHMLETAGWSERARADIEVFVLVDTEGLTPLLTVLNEQAPEEGTESAKTTAGAPGSARPEPVG